MEPKVLGHRARCPLFSFRLIKKSPLPVAPMEAEESPQSLGVPMLDARRRLREERPPLHPPAVAKLAIFGGGRVEVRVETAARQVSVAAHGNIIAREKIRVRRIAVEVLIDHFEDELARLGEEIVFQAVESRAADERLGIFAQSGDEFFQPGRRGEAVVVGESEEFSACLGDTSIACASGAGVLLGYELEFELRRPALWIEGERRFASIIHHDHLETPRRQSLCRQGIEASFHGPCAVAGGDDDANAHRQL